MPGISRNPPPPPPFPLSQGPGLARFQGSDWWTVPVLPSPPPPPAPPAPRSPFPPLVAIRNLETPRRRIVSRDCSRLPCPCPVRSAAGVSRRPVWGCLASPRRRGRPSGREEKKKRIRFWSKTACRYLGNGCQSPVPHLRRPNDKPRIVASQRPRLRKLSYEEAPRVPFYAVSPTTPPRAPPRGQTGSSPVS